MMKIDGLIEHMVILVLGYEIRTCLDFGRMDNVSSSTDELRDL